MRDTADQSTVGGRGFGHGKGWWERRENNGVDWSQSCDQVTQADREESRTLWTVTRINTWTQTHGSAARALQDRRGSVT